MDDEIETGPSAWLDRAEDDLIAARTLLAAALWDLAAFHAQQAAEKSLKAAQPAKLARFDRSHDLVRIAKSVGAPNAVQLAASLLAPLYTIARYPDVGGSLPEKDAEAAIKHAQEVIAWVRTLRL